MLRTFCTQNRNFKFEMYSTFLTAILKLGRFFQGVVTKIDLFVVIFRSEIKKILQGGEVSHSYWLR